MRLFSIMSSSDSFLICRIFLAGDDGCLYEIGYQAEDGWFHRKCRKINHSSSLMSYLIPSFLTSKPGTYVWCVCGVWCVVCMCVCVDDVWCGV